MTTRSHLEQQLAYYAQRLATLDSLPEPNEQGLTIGQPRRIPPIIHWRMAFGPGGRVYNYAAIRCTDSREPQWFTTGPNSPKGYTWDELVDWLLNRGHRIVGSLWLAGWWIEWRQQ